MKRTFLQFNKEIFTGEITGWISSPLTAYIVSQFTKSATIISLSAIIGGLIGASVLWLSMHIHNRRKNGRFTFRQLVSDITYFSPVAFLLGLFVYNPTVYFISHYLLDEGEIVVTSIISSQLVAFTLFLIAINTYRYLLHKFAGKDI